MVQEATWGAHKDGDAFSQACLLFLRVFTAHYCRADHVCEHLGRQALQFNVDLGSKLSSRAKNYAIGTVFPADFLDFH
jgi:hypothetical protein